MMVLPEPAQRAALVTRAAKCSPLQISDKEIKISNIPLIRETRGGLLLLSQRRQWIFQTKDVQQISPCGHLENGSNFKFGAN